MAAYRAVLADENAWARARRPKYCKLANNPRLRQAVAGKLRLDWSPEQIAGWLSRERANEQAPAKRQKLTIGIQLYRLAPTV
jgi:IS30 family transposase